jgi:PBSX family phage terminase large subunit
VAEFHRRKEKIRLLLGGNQSGKTISTTWEVVNYCRQHPGTLAWACTESYELVGEALYPRYEALISTAEIDNIAWLNYAKGIPSRLRWKNGSLVVFKSYEQGRKKFQAAGVDIIQLDEEPPKDIYMECLARTSATNGQIIFSMTPLQGKTYVHDDLYLKAPTSEHIWCETISYLENRFIPDEEKQVLIELYGEDEIPRRVYGLWTMLEGAVWKELNEDVHFIPRFPIPRDWRRIRSIDLGYEDPFCCLWLAESPKKEIFVYQEYYKSATLLKDHAKAIQERDEWGLADDKLDGLDQGIVASISDHERQERAELESYGIHTQPANKAVELGIQIVNRLFKAEMLYIFDDLEHTKQESRNYRYKPGTELPIKKNDHTQDPMRYGVMHFTGGRFSRPPVVLISPPKLPATSPPPLLVSPPGGEVKRLRS